MVGIFDSEMGSEQEIYTCYSRHFIIYGYLVTICLWQKFLGINLLYLSVFNYVINDVWLHMHCMRLQNEYLYIQCCLIDCYPQLYSMYVISKSYV